MGTGWGLRGTVSAWMLAAVAGIGLSGCGGPGGGPPLTVGPKDLQGEWKNARGAVLAFPGKRSFTSAGLEEAVEDFSFFCEGVHGRARGSWSFYAPAGSSGSYSADSKATRGRAMALDFTGHDECSLMVKVSGRQADPRLCLVFDPDDSCDAGERLRRVDE